MSVHCVTFINAVGVPTSKQMKNVEWKANHDDGLLSVYNQETVFLVIPCERLVSIELVEEFNLAISKPKVFLGGGTMSWPAKWVDENGVALIAPEEYVDYRGPDAEGEALSAVN